MTIETVDVGWCKEITDRGATQIAQRSKSLRYLGLMRCDQVRSLCLSLYLILSVRVFLCLREGGSRIYVFLNENVQYSLLWQLFWCAVFTYTSQKEPRGQEGALEMFADVDFQNTPLGYTA